MHRCLYKIVLFISVFISANAVLISQGRISTFPVTEKVYAHLDKQVYIAGEALKYKVYLINTQGKPCSRILYFNLTGSGSDNQFSWRIYIDSTSASGSLKIPEDLRPGMYVFTAYTNWMRNGVPSELFSDRILIVSLTSQNDQAFRFFNHPGNQKKSQGTDERGLNLKLKTDKKEYKIKEPVILEIEMENPGNQIADLSVSVNSVSPFDSILLDDNIIDYMSPGNYTSRMSESRPCRYKIEDRGYIFSGRIIRNTDITLNKCDVWLSVIDTVSAHILFSQVDSTGEFRFYLNHSFDNKELILQLADPQMSSDCKLEIFSKNIWLSDSTTNTYTVNSTGEEYLTSAKNIRLVEAIYLEERSAPVSQNNLRGPALLSDPNRIVIPSEYYEMRNFREIASNILPEVRFGNRKDQFYLDVLSPNINAWKDNYTVLLNGVPFTDFAYLFTLGTKEIKRIEIIQPNVILGDITLPGLVSIYTHDSQVPEKYLRSHTVRFNNTVTETDKPENLKSQTAAQGDHFPVFRNSLYWNPSVIVSSGSKVAVEFPALLLTGKFVIKVEGITSDGMPLSASEFIQVTEE